MIDNTYYNSELLFWHFSQVPSIKIFMVSIFFSPSNSRYSVGKLGSKTKVSQSLHLKWDLLLLLGLLRFKQKFLRHYKIFR